MRRIPLGLIAVLLSLPLRMVCAFSNNQAASFVLGDIDFNTPIATGAQEISQAYEMDYDPDNKRLFVADLGQKRVLTYDLAGGIANGMTGSYVLGQPDFGVYGCASGQSGLCQPRGVSYDRVNKRLFVADSGNHRVLVYQFDSTGNGLGNGMDADYVLGQPGFADNSMGLSNSTMNTPHSVLYDPARNRLFVNDSGNRRILIYELTTTPLVPGGNLLVASAVLGQPDFDAVPNVSTSPVTDSNFSAMGLGYDSMNSHLYVADNANRRVLIFDVSGSITNNMPARKVLGQPDFTTVDPTPTQAGGGHVSDVAVDVTRRRVFVNGLQRVLVYDISAGITNGMLAVNVLGQPDFASMAFSLDPKKRIETGYGIFIEPIQQNLFVASWSRVLVFSEQSGCGSLSICGTVRALENPANTISGVLLELRDATGKVLTSRKSGTDGTYSFTDDDDGLVVNETYYVSPLVNRLESALPLRAVASNLSANGLVADFEIRGRPGVVEVTDGAAGSLVLISTFAYTGPNSAHPPDFGSGSTNGGSFVTTATGLNGTARVPLSSGSYFVTCWKAPATSAPPDFVRTPSVGSVGPYTATPGSVVTVSCGS